MAKLFVRNSIVVLCAVIGILNVVYFLKNNLLVPQCDVQELLEDLNMKPPNLYLDNLTCVPDVPCRYPDTADLRVIILAANRKQSLLKLLDSLSYLVTDGDRVIMEIWIDRNAKDNVVDTDTVKAALSFQWKQGPVRVHIQKRHVGIYGQWIDTWSPSSENELALILEDDLTVSPYAYRWLKAVHRQYGTRKDISGYTLQSQGIINAAKGGNLKRLGNSTTFLYSLLGSWGFSPHPQRWKEFQLWYHNATRVKSFRPYVSGLVMTSWYKEFEKSRSERSMWTMWFIYFCNKNNLYTVYNNLNAIYKKKSMCLAVHRHEPGLHYHGRGLANASTFLLNDWKEDYIKLDETPPTYNFNGKLI